ncbi:MAG: hypothetical protein V1816_15455 [Pseudomonadota bacterium]
MKKHPRRKALAGLLFASILVGMTAGLFPAPARSESFFPQYFRTIIINTQDFYGQPLSGARAEIIPVWGRLASGAELISGSDGRIRFLMEPVVEDSMAGLHVRDRFHLYRLDFRYRLWAEGRVSRAGRVEDNQEEVQYFNPAFRGLNSFPDDAPIVIEAKMPIHGTFLAPGQELTSLAQSIIEAIYPNEKYELAEGSLFLPPGGGLNVGLEFKPIFDPSEYGLNTAAVELLKGPVRDVFKALAQVRKPAEGSYRLKVGAHFQYRTNPYSPAARKEFLFLFTPAEVGLLLEGNEDRHLDSAGPVISVDGLTLDLAGPVGRPEK